MIHPFPTQSITVSSGLGKGIFGQNMSYERTMIWINPPSGSPTFSYYIVDNVTGAMVDEQQGLTAPQTLAGPVPYCNPCSLYIYGATIDGTWQVVHYVKKISG